MVRRPFYFLLLSILLLAAAAFAQDRDDDIDYLIGQLASDSHEDQEAALSRLQYAGIHALPAQAALVKVAGESNRENRLAALTILSHFGRHGAAAASVAEAALTDSDVAVRIAAARVLLSSAGPHDGAIAALEDALRRDDLETRISAARAIADAGVAAQLVAALVEAASDEDDTVRAEAAVALGAIGPASEGSLMTLHALLADESPNVRIHAARVLWNQDASADLLVPVLGEVIAAYRPDPAVEATWELATGGPPEVAAIELLAEIGSEAKPAIPALLGALASGRPSLRFAAVEALGAIGPEAAPALAALKGALRETDGYALPFVHRAFVLSDEAAAALARMWPVSKEVLIEALDSPDKRTRANAAEALGQSKSGPEEVVAALVKKLDDPHESVRAMAALSIGRIGGPAAVSTAGDLAALLNDEAEWLSYPNEGRGAKRTVSDHVLVALEKIAPPPEAIVPAIVRELEASGAVSDPMCVVLRRLGPKAKDAAPALARLLQSRKCSASAAAALARIDPVHESLTPYLRGELDSRDIDRHPDVWRRAEAARTLGDMGEHVEPFLPELAALFEKWRQFEPRAAVSVAAAILKHDPNHAAAVVVLAQELEDSLWFGCRTSDRYPQDLEETWSCLQQTAEPAAGKLLAGLTYESPNRRRDFYLGPEQEFRTRLRSAELLIDVSLHPAKVIEALIKLFDDPMFEDHAAAADLLARMGPHAEAAIPSLIDLFANDGSHAVGGDAYGNQGVWRTIGDRAVLALASIGATAIPALRTALDDENPSARRRAVDALAAIGPPAREAARDLVSKLADPNAQVRAAAAKALGILDVRDEATLAALRRAASDHRLAVRRAALAAIAKLE